MERPPLVIPFMCSPGLAVAGVVRGTFGWWQGDGFGFLPGGEVPFMPVPCAGGWGRGLLG